MSDTKAEATKLPGDIDTRLVIDTFKAIGRRLEKLTDAERRRVLGALFAIYPQADR